MSLVPNPYFAGPPATQPDTFFGRKDVLRFVDETLASPMHNVIVFYGQRRIGKTSILHQIAHRLDQDYEAVFFDMQSIVAGPAQNLLYGLAREVAGKLNIEPPNRADFQDDPDAFRTTFLPQVYNSLGQKRLLLLLDEFDALSLDVAPTELDTLPLVKMLNRIIQSDDKRVVFLFVVGRRLKDLSSVQLQIFRGARDQQIGLLKKESTVQLVTGLANGALTFQDDALERIWALTNGHPYFTQLLCHEIFSQAQRNNDWTVTPSQVDQIIDNAINAGQSALQWFWDEVPSLERFTLYSIGQLTADSRAASLDQLIEQRNTQGVKVPDIELRALPDILVDRQVLRRDPDDNYRFAVELVRRWIVTSHSWDEVARELRRSAVDEPARTVFEAGRATYQTDVEFAIQSFTRALSLNPDYVEARLWLARAKAKHGDLLGAIDEFAYVERFGGREAREARLGMADVRAQYGQKLEEQNKVEEAKQEYQRVLELDVRHTLANARLADIFLEQADEQLTAGGVEAARPFYEQAIKYCLDIETEHKMEIRLDEYSREQEAAHNWKEAELAGELSSTLITEADESREGLLRVRLGWARWHLEKHELEAAASVYHRITEHNNGNAVRQSIENDLLRYSQQQEENNQWTAAEDALKLLVELFPDDPQNKSRLADNLCRQAEYYLHQNSLTKAGAIYQRALQHDSKTKTAQHAMVAGYQSYRRDRVKDDTLQTQKLVEEAMQSLVTILSQTIDDDSINIQAYEWLAEARLKLGNTLLVNDRLAEAQNLYHQALDDLTYVLQFTKEKKLAHHHQQVMLWIKLGQISLEEARFDQAEHYFRQVLAAVPVGPPETIDTIKTIFNEYRRRQEQQLQWGQARKAIELLDQLFPNDNQVHLWLAEINVTLADWHLHRAIPDPDEARQLARSALSVSLPLQETEQIALQIKKSFKEGCRLREESDPPDWARAEDIMNRLVSLFPDDLDVHGGLAAMRTRQGDWYLNRANPYPDDAVYDLAEAGGVYRRALNDLPGDNSHLVAHLKESFRAYQLKQRPLNQPLAKQAVVILAGLLPHDAEVQQWMQEETEVSKKVGSLPRWLAVAGIALAVCFVIILLVGPDIDNVFFTQHNTPPEIGLITETPEDATTAPTLPNKTSTSTPTSSPTPEPTNTPLPPTDTPTPPPTPTETTIPPTDTPTPNTPSPTPTVSTGTATNADFTPPLDTTPTPYPALQRLEPNADESFTGANSAPVLTWQPPEEGLGPDEYYLVTLNYTDREGQPTQISRSATTNAWAAGLDLYQSLHPTERQVQWRVSVVKDNPENPQQIISLSAPGPTRTFTWNRMPLAQNTAGLDVVINPNNPDSMLAILQELGIYKSDNGGLDWSRVLSDATVQSLHIAPNDPDTVYAGNFGHVLVSQDGGTTWLEQNVHRLDTEIQVFDITTDPDNAGSVFVATQEGILHSANGGNSWTPLDLAGQRSSPLVLNIRFYNIIIANKTVYAVGEDTNIYWRGVDDSNEPWQIIECKICVSPILSIAIDPIDSNHILVGSSDSVLSITSNGGITWDRIQLPTTVATLKISTVIFNPANPQTIYAGSGNNYNPHDGQALYRSNDGGKTWGQLNGDFNSGPNAPYIQAVGVISQSIIIAGSQGVFLSDDDGVNWIQE